MGKSKRISKQSNPFADRGLDKFSQLMEELTAKRKEIAEQIGASTSDIRLTACKGSSGDWTPVYPSSVVQSSGSSSDKSASASPRASSTSRSTAEAPEKPTNLDVDNTKSSEARGAVNPRQLLARLGLTLCLLGLSGFVYATGSALSAQLLAAISVFLISFYILRVRSETASSWVGRIFRSMRQFSGIIFPGLHFQDRNQPTNSTGGKASDQNPFSSSQPQRSSEASSPPERSSEASSPTPTSSKSSLPFPSAASAATGSVVKAHIHETSSPGIENSIAMLHKPKVLPSKTPHGRTSHEEAHSKIDSASSRPKDSVRAANPRRPKSGEINSSPFKCSKAARNGPKPDIRYGILMMLTIALAGLAFGTITGIFGTTIAWYIISILEELIMAKDEGSSANAESLKAKKPNHPSSIQQKKQPQKK